MDGRGQGKEAGLVFAMKEDDGPGFGHGEVSAGDSGVGLEHGFPVGLVWFFSASTGTSAKPLVFAPCGKIERLHYVVRADDGPPHPFCQKDIPKRCKERLVTGCAMDHAALHREVFREPG